jgi:protein involved in sex pheromone biosynthesis
MIMGIIIIISSSIITTIPVVTIIAVVIVANLGTKIDDRERKGIQTQKKNKNEQNISIAKPTSTQSHNSNCMLPWWNRICIKSVSF